LRRRKLLCRIQQHSSFSFTPREARARWTRALLTCLLAIGQTQRQTGANANLAVLWREKPDMLILDMSCIARIPASVSPALVTSGPRRTSDGTLGESAPAPKVSVEPAGVAFQEMPSSDKRPATRRAIRRE